MAREFDEVIAIAWYIAEDGHDFAAQSYRHAGTLVWRIPLPEEDTAVLAEWVPFPEESAPLLTNMTASQRERLGLSEAAWASLCSMLAVDLDRRRSRR